MVCFVISNYSIVEDIGPLNITLKLYGDADIDVTVYLHKHDGTATGIYIIYIIYIYILT